MVLLHAGADFDLANAQGYTPIHLAAREGLLGMISHEKSLITIFSHKHLKKLTAS